MFAEWLSGAPGLGALILDAYSMQRFARGAAQSVERRAFDETDAQIRQQRRDLSGVCPVALLAIQLAPKIEKRNG